MKRQTATLSLPLNLQEVWACWCELLSYLEQENKFLDQLEQKLDETENLQGGAEELQEALDVSRFYFSVTYQRQMGVSLYQKKQWVFFTSPSINGVFPLLLLWYQDQTAIKLQSDIQYQRIPSHRAMAANEPLCGHVEFHCFFFHVHLARLLVSKHPTASNRVDAVADYSYLFEVFFFFFNSVLTKNSRKITEK